MKKLRVIFMGTPDFAVPALKALHQAGHDIVAVYTKAPRPKGRGQELQKSAVHDCAEALGLPVLHPLSFKKDQDAVEEFKSFKSDIAVVAAYGLILPREVLEAPLYGCINIHGSLLPRWRGASPIQHAVWYGDEQTGVTIMQMSVGLDDGDMIAKRAVLIMPATTTTSLYHDLAIIGADMVVDVLAQISSGAEIKKIPQDPSLVTYARLLKKDDGIIDWTKSARAIDCAVRALNPWPSCYTYVHGKRLKIQGGMVVEGAVPDKVRAGTILNDKGDVVCGDGRIYRACLIQFDNAKAMDFISAINGKFIAVGDILQ